MNWAKENKFLTGFLVVLVLSIGALVFFVIGAQAKLEEATNRYTQQAGEYNRLRHLAPFPNTKNLAAFNEQKTEAAKVISEFQADLAKREFPLHSMEPAEFQDKLKAAVTAVKTKAAESSVKLPEKFYLGFDRYETQPPDKNAAAALGRQLEVIHWVVNQIIDASITQLGNIIRPELPEEKGQGAGRNRSEGTERGGGGNRSGNARKDLVAYHPFDIQFICRQQQLAKILNTLIGAQAPQFLVPRAIRVKNEKVEGPARAAEAPAQADASGNPLENSKPAAFYIVGEEFIEAAIRLEMVDFAQVAAAK
jgi:hypothetical protein